MSETFAEARRRRTEKNMSQQQPANLLFVDRSAVAGWETGRRVPDATMISRIADCLGADVTDLFDVMAEADERPNVIMVDDERVILAGGGTVVTVYIAPAIR